ncbi:MAG: lipocalin family protein [Bdellovibrionales bacterium]|nr:lipocalin family protein [Bdellovibrionales bacterium]
MRTATVISLFIFSVLTAEADPMKTVDFVDVDKYLGSWYEVASIPQSFQKDCFCSRAEYSLREDGHLRVVNSCNKKSHQGKISIVEGYAKIIDKNTNSKLKVTFFWPFFGDYWIIGLDADYRYSVVSSPDRSTLWVLSRTPILDPRLLQMALDDAKRQGLNLTKLQFRSNDDCMYGN